MPLADFLGAIGGTAKGLSGALTNINAIKLNQLQNQQALEQKKGLLQFQSDLQSQAKKEALDYEYKLKQNQLNALLDNPMVKKMVGENTTIDTSNMEPEVLDGAVSKQGQKILRDDPARFVSALIAGNAQVTKTTKWAPREIGKISAGGLTIPITKKVSTIQITEKSLDPKEADIQTRADVLAQDALAQYQQETQSTPTGAVLRKIASEAELQARREVEATGRAQPKTLARIKAEAEVKRGPEKANIISMQNSKTGRVVKVRRGSAQFKKFQSQGYQEGVVPEARLEAPLTEKQRKARIAKLDTQASKIVTGIARLNAGGGLGEVAAFLFKDDPASLQRLSQSPSVDAAITELKGQLARVKDERNSLLSPRERAIDENKAEGIKNSEKTIKRRIAIDALKDNNQPVVEENIQYLLKQME